MVSDQRRPHEKLERVPCSPRQRRLFPFQGDKLPEVIRGAQNQHGQVTLIRIHVPRQAGPVGLLGPEEDPCGRPKMNRRDA